MKSRADQFLTSFLRSAMLLCIGTAALSVQAATINFEKLPDNTDPIDNLQLPIDYVFQDGRTGLSFGFDIDGDKIADTEAVIEEHGNIDVGVDAPNVCVGYTAQGGTPKDHDLTAVGDGYGDGGRWFIREKKICNIDKNVAGDPIDQAIAYPLVGTLSSASDNSFVVTYSNKLPTNLAGQMWDLDFGETFLAEVFSEAGELIEAKTVGPFCSAGEGSYPRVPLSSCVGSSRDGKGADFFFADLPTPAKRLVISFVRTNNGGGFAFDNFNGTQAFVNVNAPLDPDDDDGDGASDADDNCPLDSNPLQDDTDSDGVGDVCDICAYTPPNSVVVTDPYSPIYGCVDNDGDGILNGADQCPSTPAGDPVNNEGCTDNDGDGVEDTADQCPSTPAGEPVNNEGCTDTDGDGIGDSSDSCPNTPQGAQVNASGCTDTDGDGVEDGADQCPSTPAGDPVNNDGCTDTDGDGIADGADNCPLIANSDQANLDGDSVGDA
ncbi:thrombospondin type 3 repeat-containing protein, partial [Luminiphilus sp.]|nr:thrombospondin type 3 repeat-containing protein [Luminiphilus sp.]